MTQQPFMASPAAYEELRAGPIDFLLNWITAPSPESRAAVSRAVPMLIASHAARTEATVEVPHGVPLEVIADARIRETEVTDPGSGRRIATWQYGALAVAIEPRGGLIDVAVVLDDRDASLDASHAASWREWLRLSNALALRDWPTAITTTTLVGADATSGRPARAQADVPAPQGPADVASPNWAPEWAVVHGEARPGLERELISALASRVGLAPPAIGQEGPDGIPIDMSWPDQQLAVGLPGMSDDERNELVAAGWHIVEPVPDDIEAALVGATSGASTTSPRSDV